MPKAYATLGESTQAVFRFTCSTCRRRGRYKLETLLQLFGSEHPLPSLPRAVARYRECPYVNNPALTSLPYCGVAFDLAAEVLQTKREEQAKKSWR